ncbi:hypothetical protein AK812_SmicGene44277 [Symbiodinium microadriaticum]|uniref:Uncharacterized protein n=1 Tax=Symbiodinium microadriaticum TaxID=2951 RepID=A0A1Q9BYU8_SYMMI|nr:hypothetical protein AK812_SmicGene44277 [Symbiodinium microadriaticum]
MGCGGSCQKTARSNSYFMKAPKVAPHRVGPLPPDREMHDDHVKALNRYLKKVQKHPALFQLIVEHRRELDAEELEECISVLPKPKKPLGGCTRTRTF